MPGTDAQAAAFDRTGDEASAFIARWQKSEGSERGNDQTFLYELCLLLGVETPHPAVATEKTHLRCRARGRNRRVTFRDGKGGSRSSTAPLVDTGSLPNRNHLF